MKPLVWRQGYNIDPLREWIRRRLPEPGRKTGIVAMDNDLLIRRYGELFGLDHDGDIRFVETQNWDGVSLDRELPSGEKITLEMLINMQSGNPRFLRPGVLRTHYLEDWEWCSPCNQPIARDEKKALRMFDTAEKSWNNKPITAEELRILLVNNVYPL